MEINAEILKNDGMYLLFPDGKIMDFSRERIKILGEEYWDNPAKLPEHIREHDDFKTCTVCPYRGQKVFCSAMKPLLPFLEDMECFESYDTVAVAYVQAGQVHYVPKSSMQHALRYVTNMALLEYCEDGKTYHKYFRGISPFMGAKEASSRLFLNIYWLEKGDRAKIDETIQEMRRAILVTTKSCVKRLNLMCHSDAFMNAYVLSDGLVSGLTMDIDGVVEEYFHKG